jgi:hypothetical protein
VTKNGRIAIRLLPCAFLAACDLSTPPSEPRWPSEAALRAFDIRPLQSNNAIQTAEALFFAGGIATVCGDIPGILSWDNAETDDRLFKLGMASIAILKVAVGRVHPGDPQNGTAAEHLYAVMTIRGVDSGHEAATAGGCDAMRPVEAEGFRAFRAWRPAEPPDPERR